MKIDPLSVKSYDYDLPKELIATQPANPRDSAKLLVYDREQDTIVDTTFKNLLSFIPKDTKIFFNDTKVIKARIFGKKQSGGRVELLLNSVLDNNDFLVFIKGKVKVGTKLIFDNNLESIVLKLQDDGSRVVKFYHLQKELDFNSLHDILEKIGHTPLPPYIKREDVKSDEIDYQSVFAKNIGAVAAPTASLHFSDELFLKTKERFDISFITLHIGAGTFKPIECENIKEHIMHEEYYNISQNAQNIINSNHKILAVGTTVTRAVEYFVRTKIPLGNANLFLHPLNRPLRVNYLLTNFHLPKSTLLMLVSSFVGIEKCLKIYQYAIKKRYKFYSYGDAMLIL